jgi:asparagine synthase (glutamine-hydrolysing)
LGEKPLYYAGDGSRFVFASEVKALLASGLVARRLHPTAVTAYLNLGSVPSPLTIIDGVQCLEPGSLLTLQDGQIRVEPYWNLQFKEESVWSEGRAGERLREEIREAVHVRLAGGDQAAAFISGGTGSSALLSVIRETLAGELRTFSVAFAGSRTNGGTPARALPERFETCHSQRVVSSDEVLRELDRIVAAMDQPSVNAIRSYFVSRTARALNARVALCGLGGEELFGGYSTFRLAPRLLKFSRLPERFGENSRSMRALRAHSPLDGERRRIAAFLRRAPSLERAYLAAKGLCPDKRPERILSGRFIRGSAVFDPEVYLKDIGAGYPESSSNRICRLELRTDLHNRLLRDNDAMSTAHSVEIRSPFLDDRVVEFLTEVPASVKFASRPKHLLGETVAGGTDPYVRDHGETADLCFLDSWLRHEWREVAGGLLSRPNAMSVELFDRDCVRRLWEGFLRRQAPGSQVWSALILQLWIRHHIDGEISLLPLGYQFAREA